MASRPHGGTSDSVIVDPATGEARPYSSFTAWSAKSGGTQITEIYDPGGAPYTAGIGLTDAYGAVDLGGPTSGLSGLWIDAGAGTRFYLPPRDLTDRVSILETGGVIGQPGTGTGLPAPVNYTLLAATPIPVPAGTPTDGQVTRYRLLASGAARTVTFDAGYRTSDAVTSRAIVIASGQVLLVDAEYTALTGWVLIRAVASTGTAQSGTQITRAVTDTADGLDSSTPATSSSSTLDAGADTTLTTAQTFTRTATEPGGVTVTARKWEIISGPLGTGMTVGTAAALSWKPGSSTAGSNDIRMPTFQELAYQLTSTAENSTTVWTTAYRYIEDINDNRGYTAGLVGFCSGTGDMLQLVQQYVTEKPSGNGLASYISGLQQCATVGFGSGASAAATTYLGNAFKTAWQTASDNDPIFRKVQRDYRKSMYWDDALAQAIADGMGPLGLCIYYDVLVNHGPGSDSDSFGGILTYVRANNTKPASGGNMTTWLLAITNRRDAILKGWGDDQSVDGRVFFHKLLINGGTVGGVAQAANLNLVAPIKWTCYGDPFTVSARPDPVADALLGIYKLRYTATGAGSDEVLVTVQ